MNLILAPHPDDELIGCFEILKNRNEEFIILHASCITDVRRLDEIGNIKSGTNFNIKKVVPVIYVSNYIQKWFSWSELKKITIYAPDPIYETHPLHREWGHVGENLARRGLDVIFYSINMRAPYIHEVRETETKEKLIRWCYPSQRSLIESDKKYILFEGRCKWIF